MTATGYIRTEKEFDELVARIEAQDGYVRPAAFAIGTSRASSDGDGIVKMLDVDFDIINVGESFGTAAVMAHCLGVDSLITGGYPASGVLFDKMMRCFAPFEGDGKTHANINAIRRHAARPLRVESIVNHYELTTIAVISSFTDPVRTVADAYLRLWLLSTRAVKPHEVNVDGMFGALNNVVWTNHGPVDPDCFDEFRRYVRTTGGHLHVYGVDKFPCMLDYVVPSGVRIADGSRVRLGAYLGKGTTVMHEGFVNFNAGCEGPNMVEGRISAGVFVGADTDLGGGCSTMGTLSGGGTEIISVGERCLIGANAGIGISLGDDCTVEAGLYVTGGTPVTLIDGDVERTVKASVLSGQSGLLFRRDGVTGRVEVLLNTGTWDGLNEMLHNN